MMVLVGPTTDRSEELMKQFGASSPRKEPEKRRSSQHLEFVSAVSGSAPHGSE